MSEAARRVASLHSDTWIWAKRQTAGRGRRGRAWVDTGENLAATLVTRHLMTAHEASLRSFVAATALFDTLAIYFHPTRLSLKWPNDVLLDGGKVAGILLESSGTGQTVDWLSIGIGVNLGPVPSDVADAAFAPVSVSELLGETVAPQAFLTQLAGNFARHEALMRDEGFETIRANWLAHAARLGDIITARTGRETTTGIFETIDQDGNLVLITGGGAQTIAAADVHF